MSTLPTGFAHLITAFAPLFSKRVFLSIPVLVVGAILVTGKRTVTAVLCVMGLDPQSHFQTDHRVLNPAAWSPLAASRILLFIPSGAHLCVIGVAAFRSGRRHRAALGRQDGRAQHLPRSGAIFPQPLRQGWRLALAVHDAARVHPVGDAGVGAALS